MRAGRGSATDRIAKGERATLARLIEGIVTAPTFRIASTCPTCGAALVVRTAKSNVDTRIDVLVTLFNALAGRARTIGWPSRAEFADDLQAQLAALRGLRR